MKKSFLTFIRNREETSKEPDTTILCESRFKSKEMFQTHSGQIIKNAVAVSCVTTLSFWVDVGKGED